MGTLSTIRSAATAMAEAIFLQTLTDIIDVGGVHDLTSTNHFKVVQRGAGANMSVDVGMGRAFVKGSVDTYPVIHSASVTNKTVTSNSSGNPRVDAVVLYIDTAASADATASNVATLIVIAGTPAGSPVAPTDAEITTALSSKPFLRLADIAVANGAASIVTANITDQRVIFRTVSGLKIQSATDAAPTNYDIASGNFIRHTMGASRTLTVTNVKTRDMFFVELTTGGYTPTWFSGITWADGIVPVVTTGIDIFAFICVSTGVYRGTIVGQGYA